MSDSRENMEMEMQMLGVLDIGRSGYLLSGDLYQLV